MNNSEYSPNVPAKRKRGRPRKDPTLIRLAIAPPPPGFETPNGSQDPSDPVIGQSVTGVVEATFEAGFLLSVKIGNSNTRLRGVVFKPGHYTPVTTENDVAPHLQMIKRNEAHFRPGQSQSQTRPGLTRTPSSKKNSSAIVPAPSAAPPVGPRGTVVPVVLQPVNMSNGVMMSEPKGIKMTTPGDVTKGLDGSSESSETPVEEREGGSDTSEPLFIEPLQTVHTHHHTYNHLSASIPRSVDSNRTGRMTELLMAVQENMPENHFPRVEIPISGSTISFQQPRSAETNVGDENHRYRT